MHDLRMKIAVSFLAIALVGGTGAIAIAQESEESVPDVVIPAECPPIKDTGVVPNVCIDVPDDLAAQAAENPESRDALIKAVCENTPSEITKEQSFCELSTQAP